MGRAERLKGHNFEREVAQAIREYLKIKAERNLEYQTGHSGDINTPEIPVFWSCKCQARPNVFRDWKEALKLKASRPEAIYTVLVTRKTNQGTIAVMDWTEFLDILKMAFLK